jgi:hypothetical protein
MSCLPVNSVCHDLSAYNLFRTGGGPVSGSLVNNWSVSAVVNGVATIKLDNGYTLELNENSSRITIVDECGRRTSIWGDPHVDENAVAGTNTTDWNFLGTTSFKLLDGTKITIDTEKWNDAGTAKISDSVVVTKGDKSLVISGLGQASTPGGTKLGDLKITKGMSGCELDAKVWDGGLTAYEAVDGKWTADLGKGTLEVISASAANKAAAMELSKATQPGGTHPPLSDCQREQIAEKCVQTTCFSWLEALAAALGGNLSRQVDKISALYKAVNFCNGVKAGCVVSKEEYLAFCKNAADCGLEFKGNGWTQNADGTYTAGEAAATECGNIQQTLQTMLTASAQQFQLLATMNSTVLNSISQGMQTIARAG